MDVRAPPAVRREHAARRRLRVILAAGVWLGLIVAVAVGLARVAGDRGLGSVLASPGLWSPVAVLAAVVVGVWLVRRTFGRREFRLEASRLFARPSWLSRLITGASEQAVTLDELREVRLLSTRFGTDLVLCSPDEEAAPLLFPLAHGGTPELLAALARVQGPRWAPAAAEAREALTGNPGFGALSGERSTADPLDRAPALRAAGLWELAAAALWPAVLAHPEELELARALHQVERCRLSTVGRLSLMQALLAHHEGEAAFLLDYARLCLSVRNRVEAQAVLDRLVELEDPPAAGVFWRTALRERKLLPAPPSKGTMGIEVNLPTHQLADGKLIVDGRFKVGLEWFIGYRLLSGFWGPPRRIQLVDLHGQTHVVLGDPLDWAARLERAAPHLAELHDEGFRWPGTGARIRRLRRYVRKSTR